jgi:hypothetical protein
MVIGLKLGLVLVGLVVWLIPSRFSDVGKWTYIVSLASWLGLIH